MTLFAPSLVTVVSLSLTSSLLAADPKITAEKSDTGVDVKIDGKPFATYVFKSGAKPIVWPIIGPTGEEMTRAWPMKDGVEGEKKDHIHHRSFWFTHDKVNDVGFWNENPGHGSIVHREFVQVEGGEQATIVTRNDWVGPDGKKICEDERALAFGADDGDRRWIDFDITLTASEGPVTFGDTKEGTFAVATAGDVNDDGPEPPPVDPVSRTGDLWALGDHRILCGDSTKAEDLARVMGGEKAALLATDPPYCVNYTGMDRPIHDGKPSGKDWSHVYREVDIKDLGVFLDGVFTAVLPHVRDDAGIYVWHAHVQQPTIAAAFEKHGLLLHQVCVWVKPVATFGHSYYRWKHEPCAFGWKKGHKPAHGFGQLDSVWEVDWDGKARVVGNEHPTEKPTRLFEIPMEQHTRPRDLVLEPFSGSGSQLVAAEKLMRRCAALELSPAFVDVAIRRWEGASGKEALLDGTSKSFSAIAKERGVA